MRGAAGVEEETRGRGKGMMMAMEERSWLAMADDEHGDYCDE